MNQHPRFVITGGRGFIGSWLASSLATRFPEPILILDNLHRPSRSGPASDRIEFRNLDIRQGQGLLEALRGAETVFHLAAESRVLPAAENPQYTFDSNVVGTLNVLTAARAAGVRRVVFVSSREVYGTPASLPVSESAKLNPVNEYGASKAAAEMYCRAFSNTGLQVSVLRLVNVYGPLDRDRVIPLFIATALAGSPLKIFSSEKVLDFLWVGHVVEALVRAGVGEYVPGPVNIGSGKGIRLVDLAERVIQLCKSSSPVHVLAGRPEEVERFVADVALSHTAFALPRIADPLDQLPATIRWIQEALTHAGPVSAALPPKARAHGHSLP